MLNFDGDTNVDVKSEQALSANGTIKNSKCKKAEETYRKHFQATSL